MQYGREVLSFRGICCFHLQGRRDEATSSSSTLVPILNYIFSHPIEAIFRCVHSIAKSDH